jgi:hypothetical protein
LCSLIPLDVIPRIPVADLTEMHQGMCHFVQADTLEDEFLALVDLFDRVTPEQREQKRQAFRSHIDLARRQTYIFRADILIEASLARSYSRLVDLIEGRVPEPGYPELGP